MSWKLFAETCEWWPSNIIVLKATWKVLLYALHRIPGCWHLLPSAFLYFVTQNSDLNCRSLVCGKTCNDWTQRGKIKKKQQKTCSEMLKPHQTSPCLPWAGLCPDCACGSARDAWTISVSVHLLIGGQRGYGRPYPALVCLCSHGCIHAHVWALSS